MTNKSYDDKTLKKLQSIELEILKDFVELCENHNLTYFGIAGTGIGAIRHGGFIPWDDDIDVAMPREDYDKFIKIAENEYDKYTILDGLHYPNYPLLTCRWLMNGTSFIEWPLKDIECPNGIFLDVYPLDQIPDNETKFKWQAIRAFFWSKLLILRSIPDPVLPITGNISQVILIICKITHWFLKTFNVSKKWLYQKCLDVSTQYNKCDKTKRIDFLCGTNSYIEIHYIEDIYPLKTIKFEDIDLKFPKHIEKNLERQYGDYMTLPPKEKRKNHYPYKLDFGIKK